MSFFIVMALAPLLIVMFQLATTDSGLRASKRYASRPPRGAGLGTRRTCRCPPALSHAARLINRHDHAMLVTRARGPARQIGRGGVCWRRDDAGGEGGGHMLSDTVLLSRLQFASTIVYHIPLPAYTIGTLGFIVILS